MPGFQRLRKNGIAGATAFRGIEGFGSHNQLHMAKVFFWFPDLPILIEAIDDEEKLRSLLPELDATIPEGLVTMEDIEYLRKSRSM